MIYLLKKLKEKKANNSIIQSVFPSVGISISPTSSIIGGNPQFTPF
jgi:hypothetical protein